MDVVVSGIPSTEFSLPPAWDADLDPGPSFNRDKVLECLRLQHSAAQLLRAGLGSVEAGLEVLVAYLQLTYTAVQGVPGSTRYSQLELSLITQGLLAPFVSGAVPGPNGLLLEVGLPGNPDALADTPHEVALLLAAALVCRWHYLNYSHCQGAAPSDEAALLLCHTTLRSLANPSTHLLFDQAVVQLAEGRRRCSGHTATAAPPAPPPPAAAEAPSPPAPAEGEAAEAEAAAKSKAAAAASAAGGAAGRVPGEAAVVGGAAAPPDSAGPLAAPAAAGPGGGAELGPELSLTAQQCKWLAHWVRAELCQWTASVQMLSGDVRFKDSMVTAQQEWLACIKQVPDSPVAFVAFCRACLQFQQHRPAHVFATKGLMLAQRLGDQLSQAHLLCLQAVAEALGGGGRPTFTPAATASALSSARACQAALRAALPPPYHDLLGVREAGLIWKTLLPAAGRQAQGLPHEGGKSLTDAGPELERDAAQQAEADAEAEAAAVATASEEEVPVLQMSFATPLPSELPVGALTMMAQAQQGGGQQGGGQQGGGQQGGSQRGGSQQGGPPGPGGSPVAGQGAKGAGQGGARQQGAGRRVGRKGGAGV